METIVVLLFFFGSKKYAKLLCIINPLFIMSGTFPFLTDIALQSSKREKKRFQLENEVVFYCLELGDLGEGDEGGSLKSGLGLHHGHGRPCV